MTWPAKSPGLNIVENVLVMLVERVELQGRQYRTVKALQETLGTFCQKGIKKN